MEARLRPAGRYVDPVLQHSRRHHVGLIRDLVKAGSFGFGETATEHVGFFFVAKKAGAQRFNVMHVQATDIFWVPMWTVALRGGSLPCRIPGSFKGRSKLV